ncbi:hypothetical protein ACFL13_01550 [Patescibacteria group bacterium]
MKFAYEKTAQVSEAEFEEESKRLEEYILKLRKVAEEENYSSNESSINLPFDEGALKNVINLHKELITPKLKYVLDIGIGGSSLGTRAVYDAFYGHFDTIEPLRYPKMIFADTDNPPYLAKLKYFLKSHIYYPEEIIINAISKSGTTAETIANLGILAGDLPFAKERLVVTTERDTELHKAAESLGIKTLEIPKKVGGRFSVFSSVGLFPLACAGVDLPDLLQGAMEARKVGLQKDTSKNPAAQSAIVTFINYKKGKLINDSFFFNPELESLGKWYRQLLAESIGKDGKGTTPTVSLGSVDLHSMVQLYLGGIKDKYFTFISTEDVTEGVVVPKNPILDVLHNLEGKSAKEIMDAILQGVKRAFSARKIPFSEVILKNLSAKSLGFFMQLKMIEMMYLGHLFGVNTFNQPDVEDYKTEVRKILKIS